MELFEKTGNGQKVLNTPLLLCSYFAVFSSCWRSLSYRNQSSDLQINGLVFYMIETSVMKVLKGNMLTR